jgi:hypothetical protein
VTGLRRKPAMRKRTRCPSTLRKGKSLLKESQRPGKRVIVSMGMKMTRIVGMVTIIRRKRSLCNISMFLNRNQKKSHLSIRKRNHRKKLPRRKEREERGKFVKSLFLKCQFRKYSTRNIKKKRRPVRKRDLQEEKKELADHRLQ